MGQRGSKEMFVLYEFPIDLVVVKKVSSLDYLNLDPSTSNYRRGYN